MKIFILFLIEMITISTALGETKLGGAVMQGHDSQNVSYRLWLTGEKPLGNQFGLGMYVQGERVVDTKDAIYTKGTMYRKSKSRNSSIGLFLEGNFEQYTNQSTFTDRRIGIQFEIGLTK